MRIVTLTTDFGVQDSYVAELKGVLLGINPQARIVDICHTIRPQNVKEAAFVLFLAYKYFPKGTIHTVVVDPGVGGSRRVLLVRTARFYFIAPDNGVLTYILNAEKKVVVREVTNPVFFNKVMSATFEGRDKMIPLAAHLSRKTIFAEVGKIVNEPYTFLTPNPVRAKNKLYGEIIYADHFGNVVTNFTRALLDGNTVMDITVNKTRIDSITHTYSDVTKGGLLATYGSSGFLEIAINCGSAQKRLNALVGDKVTITVGKKG